MNYNRVNVYSPKPPSKELCEKISELTGLEHVAHIECESLHVCLIGAEKRLLEDPYLPLTIHELVAKEVVGGP